MPRRPEALARTGGWSVGEERPRVRTGPGNGAFYRIGCGWKGVRLFELTQYVRIAPYVFRAVVAGNGKNHVELSVIMLL